MRITSNNKQENTELITIILDKEDYTPRIEESLKKYSKSVKVPGFRPGRASISHLKLMYGNSVFFEEINKIFNESLNDYIQKNNLDIVGEPLLVNPDVFKNLSMDNAKEINCEFEIGLSPDMLIDLNSQEFIKYNILPKDEDIQKEIELIQKAFADRKDIDKVDDVSMVSLQIEKEFLDTDKKEQATYRLLDTKNIKSETVKSIFLGLHLKNSFSIGLDNLSSDEKTELLEDLLKLQDKASQVNDIKALKITINKIWKETILDIDSELFKRVFPTDIPKNIDEFKSKVSSSLASRNKEHSELNLAGQIFNYIEKALESKSLPESFLKKWLKQTNPKLTDNNLEEGFSKFLDNLRWSLFERKVQKDEKIEISNEELTQAAVLHITETASLHGYKITSEQIQDHTKELLKDKNSLHSLYQNTLSAKVYKQLRGQVKLKNEDITFDAFDKINKEFQLPDLAYKIAKEALIRGYLAT